MKTNVKKLVIWLVIIMAVSFGIAAIVLVMTGNFSVASEKIDDSKQFDPEGITEIVVDIVSPELNIIPSDRKDIVVHFHGETSTNIRRNIPELVAYKTGSKLNIEIHQPGGFFIGINFQRTTMDVYVPQVQLERMELKTVSGNVTMEDTRADNFEVETVSGKIKAQRLYAQEIKARSISGDITINDYSGNVDAGSTSGDISVTGGNKNEDISMKTVSGDILIEQDAVSDMELETTSGNVKIKLPEDAEFGIKINTVSGKIRYGFPLKIISSGSRDLEGSVGDPDLNISVNTVSGDIVIGYQESG